MMTFANCSCRYLSQCPHTNGARMERRQRNFRRGALALATLGIIAAVVMATQYAMLVA